LDAGLPSTPPRLPSPDALREEEQEEDEEKV